VWDGDQRVGVREATARLSLVPGDAGGASSDASLVIARDLAAAEGSERS
jgi:hypothetical protein